MEKAPEGITVCQLEVLLMPNKEIICAGKTLGWFDEFKKYLEIKNKENASTKI